MVFFLAIETQSLCYGVSKTKKNRACASLITVSATWLEAVTLVTKKRKIEKGFFLMSQVSYQCY